MTEEKSTLETLKNAVKVENTPWGGHRLIYGIKEYAMNWKIHELTEEQAERIIEIMGIGQEKDVKTVAADGYNLCECGCGQHSRKGRKFLPGHDMKLKSRLRKEAKAGSTSAAKELKRRGWTM